MKEKISIITPTYQGRERLYAVYDSIKKQHHKPIEWIIVIDGYDKKTDDICSKFKIDDVEIKVFTIKQNHKKAAMNFGINKAVGDFILIADDDDPFPEMAIHDLCEAWSGIDKVSHVEYVGVTGLCDDGNSKIIGDKFPQDIFDSNHIECFFKYNIKGEKWGMQRRDILQEYPFFEDAEGYIEESTVWMEIGKKYKTRYINKVVRNYIERDGSIMTSQMNNNKILTNCQAYVFGYRYTAENFLKYIFIRPKYIVGCSSNYVRYLMHSVFFKKTKKWMFSQFRLKRILVTIIGFPVGVYFFAKDKLQ